MKQSTRQKKKHYHQCFEQPSNNTPVSYHQLKRKQRLREREIYFLMVGKKQQQIYQKKVENGK